LGWARFTRQSAPACWRTGNAQPPGARAIPMLLALQGSAARALPGSSLFPLSSTLQTPASGAADSYTLGGIEINASPERGKSYPCIVQEML